MAVPTWPVQFQSQSQLITYLRTSNLHMIHNCWYTVDFFHPPLATPHFCYSVKCVGNDKHLTIRVAPQADDALKALFKDQVDCLNAPITADDIADVEHGREPVVYPWTHAEHFPSSSGVIKVHTNFTQVHTALSSDNAFAVTTPKQASEFPFTVGDWVLMQVTMHKLDAPVRAEHKYELRALHMRLVEFGAAAHVPSTISKADEIEDNPRAEPSHTADEVAPSPVTRPNGGVRLLYDALRSVALRGCRLAGVHLHKD
ncbi:hypothetical protein B0H13DRAFT_2322811 [Mycena leptocephala]|nr:hypothetical protein B0H13DRAFT_2322811 [Mycena leptocephala]